MKEPSTPEEVLSMHKILRTDPHRYVQIVNEWIGENPNNAHAYFDRHYGWMKMGEPRRALEDLDKAIALDPDMVSYLSRGSVYRHLGQYEQAITDYSRAEALDPAGWENDSFGLLFQADCHARLGDLGKALACCARLPDDFWTPGLNGAPAGDKTRIAEGLTRIVGDAPRGEPR